jgi:hypothetical protein
MMGKEDILSPVSGPALVKLQYICTIVWQATTLTSGPTHW